MFAAAMAPATAADPATKRRRVIVVFMSSSRKSALSSIFHERARDVGNALRRDLALRLERRRILHRYARRAKAPHRRLEHVEELIADRRGDLAAEAAGHHRLVDDEEAAGAAHRLEYRLAV